MNITLLDPSVTPARLLANALVAIAGYPATTKDAATMARIAQDALDRILVDGVNEERPMDEDKKLDPALTPAASPVRPDPMPQAVGQGGVKVDTDAGTVETPSTVNPKGSQESPIDQEALTADDREFGAADDREDEGDEGDEGDID